MLEHEFRPHEVVVHAVIIEIKLCRPISRLLRILEGYPAVFSNKKVTGQQLHAAPPRRREGKIEIVEQDREPDREHQERLVKAAVVDGKITADKDAVLRISWKATVHDIHRAQQFETPTAIARKGYARLQVDGE